MGESKQARCACGAVELDIKGDPPIMAFCHCDSCRSWLSAPIHAAALWPTDSVTVVKGEDSLGVYIRTEASLRHFCRNCGAAVFIRHPELGMTDVPAGSVTNLDYNPSIHVHYAERVMDVRDGLPKFAAMPAADRTGEMIPE